MSRDLVSRVEARERARADSYHFFNTTGSYQSICNPSQFSIYQLHSENADRDQSLRTSHKFLFSWQLSTISNTMQLFAALALFVSGVTGK